MNKFAAHSTTIVAGGVLIIASVVTTGYLVYKRIKEERFNVKAESAEKQNLNIELQRCRVLLNELENCVREWQAKYNIILEKYQQMVEQNKSHTEKLMEYENLKSDHENLKRKLQNEETRRTEELAQLEIKKSRKRNKKEPPTPFSPHPAPSLASPAVGGRSVVISSPSAAENCSALNNSVMDVNWEKRTKIAEEIVETERSYVNSLSLMLEVFFKKFNANASEPEGFLSVDDIKKIFSCSEIILAYNKELLNNLEEVLKAWDPRSSKIGDVFVKTFHFLRIYSAYVSNYTTALRTLEKCRKDQQFEVMLQEAERDPRLKNMPLTGFLIMPVQRIPRYLMLLKELLKCTPPEHVDFSNLKMAQDRISTVALEVNEAERNAENLNTVYQIQKLLSGQIETIVEPHRRLIKHGRVLFREKGKEKESYLMLFNDMVILTKQKGKFGIKKPMLDGDDETEEGNAKVVLQIDISKVFVEPSGEIQFLLKTTEKKHFLLESENSKKAREWVVQFQETKDKYEKLTITNPPKN